MLRELSGSIVVSRAVWSAAVADVNPKPRISTSLVVLEIRNTVGRLKKYTTNRSSAVATPSVRANPRTELTAVR